MHVLWTKLSFELAVQALPKSTQEELRVLRRRQRAAEGGDCDDGEGVWSGGFVVWRLCVAGLEAQEPGAGDGDLGGVELDPGFWTL